MLDSLLIKNYRVLKELKVNSLEQINLITGKNNTGKSTVFESIAIYACKGNLNELFKLLKNRGEYSGQLETCIHYLSSLFSGRTIAFGHQNAIVIGNVDNTKYVNLQYVKYIDTLTEDGENNIAGRKILPDSATDNYKTGFRIDVDSYSSKLFIDEKFNSLSGYTKLFIEDNFQFINNYVELKFRIKGLRTFSSTQLLLLVRMMRQFEMYLILPFESCYKKMGVFFNEKHSTLK